jgi:hypothetical protein
MNIWYIFSRFGMLFQENLATLHPTLSIRADKFPATIKGSFFLKLVQRLFFTFSESLFYFSPSVSVNIGPFAHPHLIRV